MVLGGWSTAGAGDPKAAKWFCLKLSKEDVPWLFKEGKGSSWASTSAEMLASHVGVQLFIPARGVKVRSSGEVIFSGGTDNKANDAFCR